MKLIKHSQTICSFCLSKVSEYFTNNSGEVLCKSCLALINEEFQNESD